MTHSDNRLAESQAASSADTEMSRVPDCADEEIRLPGAIQRHGFLVGIDAAHERIVLLSGNAEEFLDTPVKLLLGAPIEDVLPRELLSSVRSLPTALDSDNMVTYLGTYHIRGELFSVITHSVDGVRLLELERQDRLVGPELMNAVITNFVGTLSKLESEQEVCDAITRQFAQLTGLDRVLLYSFDEEGHGTVLSEVNNGRLPSYLGLRFPSSDIPRQARELYVLNTVRIIPNSAYTPSPIIGVKDHGPHTLDLSLSTLRSVSPVHLEYMRNMGTMSSMSVSILSEGRLWGLIGGHHAEPRTVPYLVRSACDMLARLVGTQLATMRTSKRLRTTLRFHSVQRRLLTQIAADSNYLSALAAQIPTVMEVANASGAALVMDGTVVRHGNAPPEQEVLRIVEWLGVQPEFEVYQTDRLGAKMPETESIGEPWSGLLAIRVSDVRSRWLLWFRPEIVSTVHWAGEPVKSTDAFLHLHPRNSFGVWKETVRGCSLPWTTEEVESAQDFRSALITVGLQRAEEEVELSTARFQQLAQALPAKVFMASDSGELTYVNDRWRNAHIQDEGVWFRGGRLAPEDESRCEGAWQRAVHSGDEFEEEVRLLDPASDDRERWNLVRAVPFRRAGLPRAGWIGVLTDLTERKEREAALRMAEKLALTGRMTSVIAHEINNPLESLTNLLYLLRNELPQGGDAANYIGMAESELERISGITKQTLRWSRETSEIKECITAGALFEDVLRLFRGKIRNRQIVARVRDGHNLEIFGIVGQLRQVVANLLSNAVDAAPVGGSVWLSAEQTRSGNVALIVADDGTGISPEAQQLLFQPFYSTKGDLGNGLGLYISKEIVERHQGTLSLQSALGIGTTIRITLPSEGDTAVGPRDEGMAAD